MFRSATLVAGAVLLAGAAEAQTVDRFHRITGHQAPIHAGTYYAASGQFVAAPPGATSNINRSVDQVVYNNNFYTAVFSDINDNTLVTDEGRLPSLTSPTSASPFSVTGTSNSYRITQIQFAYATTSVGFGTARLGIFNQYDTCTNPLGSGAPVLDLIITGLPGTLTPGTATPYTFDIDMSGFEFCMRADGDGKYDDEFMDRFGFLMLMTADVGSLIGPIHGAAPAVSPYGDGTVFSNETAPHGTGLSTLDQYHRIRPGVGAACVNEGGYDPVDNDPVYASFWFVLASDLAVSCSSCADRIDDNFEENDDCTSAATLAAPASYSNLVVEKRNVDPDFYRVTIPPNTQLNVAALFTHLQADIDVRLTNDDCTQLFDISQTTSDNEFVDYFNCGDDPIDVTIEVYVWNFASTDCGDYNLELTFDTSCVTDDGLEDNDSCLETIPLPQGFTGGLRISECDLDYFDITLDNGETLTVTMTTNTAEADLDLFLFLADATCDTNPGILTQAFTTNAVEMITWQNTTGQEQDYVMRVDVFSLEPGFNCTGYSLQFDMSGGTPLGDKFCFAELNSTGQGAHIFATGSDEINDNMFFLNAEFLPQNSFGYFLTSQFQVFVANPGGSQGNLCIAGNPIGRFNDLVQNTGLGSTVQIQANFNMWPQPNGFIVIGPGTWNFQYWYRDANPNSTSNWTDAVQVTFVP